MEIVRMAGFALTAAFAAAVLRRLRPEAGMALALAAGVMLLLSVMGKLQAVTEALGSLCQRAKLQPVYVRTLLKAAGICFLSDAAAGVCRDLEESGLAQRVELVGRALVMGMAAPVLLSLMDQLLELTL